MPNILLPESALVKTRKGNREKARTFRSKAKANSFQLIEDEDITEGPRQGECSQGQKEKLDVKIDFKPQPSGQEAERESARA